MKYEVVFYCPDRHIVYDVHTLDQKGVGGGITARVRAAHALATQGHSVTLFANCPDEGNIDGVTYKHIKNWDHKGCDIFIAGTSGGKLDLGMLKPSEIMANKKILMIHGVDLPGSVNPNEFDSLYILSNFVRTIAINNWQVNSRKIFVTHRGVEERNFAGEDTPQRDPFSLVYLAHPSKGLDTAIAVLRFLRAENSLFTLHVYGGNQLWGGKDEIIPLEDGLIFHGMVGQKELARDLKKYSFSLNLQEREEPFGMAVTESMRGGCIVLASPVGAYPELIYTGYNGFLVPGLHTDMETRQKAANVILELLVNPGYMDYVRRNSIRFPLSWDTVAQTWESHWDWMNETPGRQQEFFDSTLARYILCNSSLLMLADGLHCVECGHYDRWAANTNFHDHLYTNQPWTVLENHL